ncbi:MAG: hypothetical protein ACTSRW_12695 [Candidatus Helarchaeota archaeon]
MKFQFSDEAKKEIERAIQESLELEEEQNKNDLGLFIYLRKGSCGPMTKGGWKEVACTVDFFHNYSKDINFNVIPDQTIKNLPICIDVEAIKPLEDREVIQIDVTKGLVKELFIVDAPMIDLGACEVNYD